MIKELDKCTICPHKCGINRNEGQIGRCKASEKIKIALYYAFSLRETKWNNNRQLCW